MSSRLQAGCHRSIVSIDGVSFSYDNKKVIDNLSFNVLERDFVGLIGSNGAGKTTLLKMLVGLLKVKQGEIRLFDEPLNTFKDWDRIGYVPQKNSLNPLFPATVREVVTSGMYGRKRLYRKLSAEDHQKCLDAMEVMRITDLGDRKIGELSGGQQQRVFLARALVNNPELLILDEPTVGIDAQTQEDFFRMIRHMHDHHHMTFIMVSHDIDMVDSFLGTEPMHQSGGLKFHVKHTHDPEDCRETNLLHSTKAISEMIEVR
ncbi:ABC transporter ATP-binding protein [Paenibacillus sp. N1-5-1-14]|uniref:metal ABC transporter ATP-binding protein n=1 Tax=Paenibacillus radicibacter TaxID=2972488 RepID=UPI0021595480|nr:ABC transporter ATP-binding protein [Paenibacillus radicibacter]MCR8642442.1 ABC transporter ATP-binding protein [Paenibacillus radicibacter]